MEEKRIEELYKLLKRAGEEKDYDAVSALSWAIFTLENQQEEEAIWQRSVSWSLSGYIVDKQHRGRPGSGNTSRECRGRLEWRGREGGGSPRTDAGVLKGNQDGKGISLL